jgi:hypothetical protein
MGHDGFRAVFYRNLSYLIPPFLLPVVATRAAAFVGRVTMWNVRAEAQREAIFYIENHAQIDEDNTRQAVLELVHPRAVTVGFFQSVELNHRQDCLETFSS